jgi:hypothetical protein
MVAALEDAGAVGFIQGDGYCGSRSVIARKLLLG